MRRNQGYQPTQVQRDIRAILQDNVIQYLYTLSQQTHQRVIDNYCYDHKQLTKDNAFFIRGYNTYVPSKVSTNDVHHVIPLHESLVEAFDEYLIYHNQQAFRDVYIKNTVANALNITESLGDLLELLPTAICNAFSPGSLRIIQKSEPKLTKTAIEQFHSENEKGMQLIREQLLVNMLEV